jgi:hypothetical protein
MSLLPSVRATLAERFIFNFRMPLDTMARHLPVPWLIPQQIRGYAVVSFCLLDLRNITIAPLPTVVGLRSLSSAPRYAVIDVSGDRPTASVFVTYRQTNSAFGAWFTSLGFCAPHPYVETTIEHHENGLTTIYLGSPTKGMLFSAVVQPAPTLCSDLFPSAQAFADFIAAGSSSYGLSRHAYRLTRIDLHKEDGSYEPLAANCVSGRLVKRWLADRCEFDSAFRTSGGRYEWTYHGMTHEARWIAGSPRSTRMALINDAT